MQVKDVDNQNELKKDNIGVDDSKGDNTTNEEQESGVMTDFKVMQDEIDSLKNQLIRMQADFTNFKARTKKNEADYVGLGVEKLAEKIFPAIDNFEIALSHIDDTNIYDGVKMIYDQLISGLKDSDILVMDSDNVDFDPDLHYAIMTEEKEGIDSGKVIETVKKGFIHGEKVIRPAMVKVSK